jgi:hypothetical protein
MRLISLFAAAAFAAVASPVFAQTDITPEQAEAATTAIEEFELSETLYQNLWCGSTFLIVETMLREQGNTADADSAVPLKDALFTKAATEAIEAGISEEDFVALSEHFRIVAISQTGEGGEADFTQEECVAAAQP